MILMQGRRKDQYKRMLKAITKMMESKDHPEDKTGLLTIKVNLQILLKKHGQK